MNIRQLFGISALFLSSTAVLAQHTALSQLRLDRLPNEFWWGGAVTLGTRMPYGVAPIDINLDGDNRGNQSAPLPISSKGRSVWYENAFRSPFKGTPLEV